MTEEQVNQVLDAMRGHGSILTGMQSELSGVKVELAGLKNEVSGFSEKIDHKILQHYVDCNKSKTGKGNLNPNNSNTFSAFGGIKLPRNAPKWLMWLIFGTAMALVGKLSEAIELFRITQ